LREIFLSKIFVFFVRFDLLAGVNKDEGATTVVGYIGILNMSDPEAGVSIKLAYKMLELFCERLTPLSVQLCAKFLIDTYKLKQLDNDIERAHRIGNVFGMFSKNTFLKRIFLSFAIMTP